VLAWRRLARSTPLVTVLTLACCTASGGPAGGAVGDPCTASADCQNGLFCEGADPGGQCQRSCLADADCGTGNLCALDSGALKCYRACRTDADCPRPGYPCVGVDGRDAERTFCDAVGGSDAGSWDG
jgi:hypothetical protein